MRGLLAVVAGQLLLASLFALRTPAWNNPDEPAHYNAIAEIATTGRLPVLTAGDHDHAALTAAVARGFPNGPRGAFLHYEDHQPPLYYLLLAPFFLATHGSLVALRLCGVVLGAIPPVATWASAQLVLPQRPRVALAAAALAAFLPQSLAGAASVNNDALVLPLVALGMLLAIRETQTPGGPLHCVMLGCVAGLALLAKLTALPLLVAAVLAVGASPEARIRRLLRLLLPVAALAGPLLLRNASLYGWSDPLALGRHALVVAGEPTAAGWIRSQGLLAWLWHDVTTALRSFFAQFGWMNVLVDFRFYRAALVVGAVAVVGFVADLRAAPGRPGGGLLALQAGCVALLFGAYNLAFVQPQGRYLLPALLPMAVGVARGLDRMAEPAIARRAARVLGLGCALLIGLGLATRDVAGWTLLFGAGGGAALVGLSRVPEAWRARLVFLPSAALPFVSAFLLFRYIPG
jgi:4-amino-4-deoxy-L-arabinose transferase-like glycosyltransferase